VLVVDDDTAVLDCYRRVLGREGYTVRTEADPLRVLAEPSFALSADLLILDYKMPGADGLTLLAELRRHESRARCILISAFLNEAVRQQARLLGVDRILDKPVDLGSLRASVAEVLLDNQPRAAGMTG
jgi:DNA-binding response OmpR family regulator